MIKKIMILILVMVFAFSSMGLLAEAKVVEVRFTAMTTTCDLYMLGVGWSNVLRKYAPDIRMTCLAKGGTTKLLRGMVNKEWEIAWIGSPHLVCAKEGILLFEKEKEYSKEKYYDPTRVLFGVLTGWCNYVVRADSDIYSIADLKGKRVHLGMAGGFGGIMTKGAFRGEGLDIDKGDYKGIYVPTEQALDQLRDKAGVDNALVWGGIPQSLITNLSCKVPLRQLSLTKEGFERFQKDFVVGPYTVLITLSPEEIKEAYGGRVVNTTPVYTWTIPLMAVVRKETDEELVYTLVKTLWEHLDEVKSVSKQLERLTFETALKSLSAPFHPGALRYYKEIGAIK